MPKDVPGPDDQPPVTDIPEVKEGPHQSRRSKAGDLGWYAVIGLVGALAIAFTGPCSDQQQRERRKEAAIKAEQEKAAKAKAARNALESDTFAMCDLMVKSGLVSEDTFDPEWGGTFAARGTIGVVSRKFTATNGFGAKLTSRYECEWDSKSDMIVSLVVTDPYGERHKIR